MNFFVIVGNSPATRIPVLLIVVGLFTVLFGVIGIVGAIFATKIGGRIILGLVRMTYSSFSLHCIVKLVL